MPEAAEVLNIVFDDLLEHERSGHELALRLGNPKADSWTVARLAGGAVRGRLTAMSGFGIGQVPPSDRERLERVLAGRMAERV